MSIYKRYFRITAGPVVDEINRLHDLRVAAGALYMALAEKHGALTANNYDHSGSFAGFTFKETPDKSTYRKLLKHGLWVPRKTGPGKAIWAEIDAIEAPKPIDKALLLVDLYPGAPSLMEGGRWYAPTVWGFYKPVNIWFVSVPWKDVDPAELAQYKLDRAAGKRRDSCLDHLLWEAPADWTEVKGWQIEKESEEINEALAK